jgi:hypothetical protein
MIPLDTMQPCAIPAGEVLKGAGSAGHFNLRPALPSGDYRDSEAKG